MSLTKNKILKQFDTYTESNDYQNILSEKLSLELISDLHSEFIIKWRNKPDNLSLFINNKKLTLSDQQRFLKDYWLRDRIDLVLKFEQLPIGVFSLTGLNSTKVYLGKLMGDTDFRGKGFSFKSSISLLNYAFNFLKIKEVFALTKVSNKPNISLNKKIGFKVLETIKVDDEDFYLMNICKESFNCVV